MPFDLNILPDGLIAIFTTKTDSQLHINESKRSAEMKNDLLTAGIDIIFAIDDEYTALIDSVEVLKKQSKLGENLVFVKKENDNLTYLTHKENPEIEGNWTEAIKQFAVNYKDTKADDKNLWKWGQIVIEDGDYLCVDCGYIGEFKQGEIFPICEVCLSGDPAGPSGPEVGYWEKV